MEFLPERGKDHLHFFMKQISQFFESFVQNLISIHLTLGSISGHLRGFDLILDLSNFHPLAYRLCAMKPNACAQTVAISSPERSDRTTAGMWG